MTYAGGTEQSLKWTSPGPNDADWSRQWCRLSKHSAGNSQVVVGKHDVQSSPYQCYNRNRLPLHSAGMGFQDSTNVWQNRVAL